MKNGRPVRRAPRKALLIAGLAAFLVVDIALVAIALNPGDTPTPSPGASPAPSASVEPMPQPTASPVPTTEVTTTPTRIMTAIDGNRAWRASTGPCGSDARPELTTDGGSTWKATNATGPTGVVSLQAIIVEGAQVASMIGQKASDCSAMLIRTFVAGDNYAEYPADLDGDWYVNPVDRAVVHAPGGNAAGPCAEAVMLAAASTDQAAVLCGDGSLFTTADQAASWAAVARTPGATAIASSGDGFLVAVVGDTTCAGVRLGSFTAGASPAQVVPGGCLASPSTPAALAGNVAVADGGGTLWLWAGDITSKSTDGGVSWR